MIIVIKDNFIGKEDCDSVINEYYKNEDKVMPYMENFIIPVNTLGNLTKIINNEAKSINNSEIDYINLVRWPIGSKQNLHFDNARSHTTLSCIIYLNENFKGGHTYLEEGTMVAPKTGRVLFFDGKYYKHGVAEVKESNRFTIACWFKRTYS
mgnify:CR=1 FL=1|jgi:Rps23 Pro-64 3,4-dihydroxylase Tpa1-like proline 4-hydroxylase